jgi:hypothetical protein
MTSLPLMGLPLSATAAVGVLIVVCGPSGQTSEDGALFENFEKAR